MSQKIQLPRRAKILLGKTFFLGFFLVTCSSSDTSVRRMPDAADVEFNEPAKRIEGQEFSASATKAMVVADKPYITQVGVDLLKQGGNAFDAAVAMSFALAVVAPESTGIGGGGFLVYHRPLTANKKTTSDVGAIDFRERAPLAARRNMYAKFPAEEKRSLDGALAVAVPGFVAGMADVHRRFGKLPWARVVEPALHLAENGFPVHRHLADALSSRQEVLARFAASRELFLPEGKPLQEGALLIQKDLAATLKLISEKGKNGFYEGVVAKALVGELRKLGGIITREDLRRYKVIQRKPLRLNYKNVELLSMPPPSSGGVHLIQMLNMLGFYDLSAFPLHSVNYIHTVAEIMRRAYADRAKYLGDPAYVNIPMEGLLSKKYALTLMSTIKPLEATPSSTLRNPDAEKFESKNTSNICVLDSEGNAVVSTHSVNYIMGSGVVIPGTGVLMNDTMDDFSTAPGVPNEYGLVGGEANAIAPGKTPLSSMTPTIVVHQNKPWILLGAPGGSQIITAVFQTLVHRLEYRLELPQAVSAKRIHHQYLPDKILIDTDLASSSTIEELTKRGHSVDEKMTGALVTAIERTASGFIGVSDPKSTGDARGWDGVVGVPAVEPNNRDASPHQRY